ncbi:alpha/beta hydrolase family protein [Mycobacteroides abscessus]|uniref:alpha/beta hydrolase family protein n=1 Tax=Mycobacteroides abscessus TaxID=36809 RepID=UPI000D9E9381|nr:chlorophyllase [Mycobacteroides abscessus]SPX80665.1 esterase [Mycobacteroides abscessus]
MTNSALDTNAVVDQATATVSVRPVVLPSSQRGDDLQLRVTAPQEGNDLPVVVFSHGFGFSMDAYGPLTDFWAAHGFVVIQPTHLDSVSLGLAPTDPRAPQIWRHRIQDLAQTVDNLDTVLAAIPGLADRADANRIAVAGHSYGATTASALLGARVLPPAGDANEDFSDARVSAGVLLCLAGLAADDLTPIATQMFPFMNPSFEHMATPALIVAGDADQSPLSTRGPDWWLDAYQHSPGKKSLLTLFRADHALGGIHAYGTVPQSESDNPITVALVQRITTAYLRNALHVDETSWPAAQDELARQSSPAGQLCQDS